MTETPIHTSAQCAKGNHVKGDMPWCKYCGEPMGAATMSTPLSEDELLDSLNELQIRLGRHRNALLPIKHIRALILEKRKLAERVEKLRP
jgi:hypothetical protein